jgi:hypothetical protein
MELMVMAGDMGINIGGMLLTFPANTPIVTTVGDFYIEDYNDDFYV